MKRFVMVLFIVLAAVATASAGEKSTSPKVRGILERALVNEREAVARYEAFAQKATEEGYLGAASLFRAAAHAEGIHARRFEAAMIDRGINVPPPAQFKIDTGSTAENLRAAGVAETQERDGIYREAVNAAAESKDDVLMTMFDQTRDTEVEHANLMLNASHHLDQMKEAKTYFVCDHCGYTTDIDLPLCALCRKDEHPGAVH